MKKLALFLLVAPAICFAQATYVRPYLNSNGQLVQGHFRSDPNSIQADNYSARGNVNPFNGSVGTRSSPLPNYEIRSPQYQQQPMRPIQPPMKPWEAYGKPQGYSR